MRTLIGETALILDSQQSSCLKSSARLPLLVCVLPVWVLRDRQQASMALGYEPHPTQRKKPGTPTPFHHPPRPIPERSRTAPVSLPIAGSAPVSVPNASSYRSPPPPLPPPRDVDTRKTDLGWHMANREGSSGYSSRPIRAGSSLLGGGPPLRKGKPFSIPERNVDIICRHEAPTSSLSPSLPTRPQPSVPLSAPKSLLSAVKDRDEVVPASPPYLDLRGLMEYK